MSDSHSLCIQRYGIPTTLIFFEDEPKKFRASENGAGFASLQYESGLARRLIGGNESGRKRAEPENIYNVVSIYKLMPSLFSSRDGTDIAPDGLYLTADPDEPWDKY